MSSVLIDENSASTAEALSRFATYTGIFDEFLDPAARTGHNTIHLPIDVTGAEGTVDNSDDGNDTAQAGQYPYINIRSVCLFV